jgi:hypothetical protein
VHKADNLPPSCADVNKSGGLNLLKPLGPVQACNGTAVPIMSGVSAGACNINMAPWEQRAHQLIVSSICYVFEILRKGTFEQVRSSLVLKLFNCFQSGKWKLLEDYMELSCSGMWHWT